MMLKSGNQAKTIPTIQVLRSTRAILGANHPNLEKMMPKRGLKQQGLMCNTFTKSAVGSCTDRRDAGFHSSRSQAFFTAKNASRRLAHLHAQFPKLYTPNEPKKQSVSESLLPQKWQIIHGCHLLPYRSCNFCMYPGVRMARPRMHVIACVHVGHSWDFLRNQKKSSA